MSAPADRLRQWLTQDALPLWAEAGVDPHGGFVERLFLDGRPDLLAAKRVRVQARQLYVYSHAYVLGLYPGADLVAAQGHAFLMAHAAPDGIGQGVVHLLGRNGSVLDKRRDTYDHAFLLFALSWYYRALGGPDVRAAILSLGEAIWTLLRHPRGRGFVVDTSGTQALHQNPHMHLFEAVLAAYDATGEAVFLERASELTGLFRERMFDGRAGVLREYFDEAWRPAAGEAGGLVEPGHHCEWVWLLKRYADAAGEPLCVQARQLYLFAQRYGRPDRGSLLCDELWDDGRVRKADRRLWPQTEAVKAEIALAEADGRELADRADSIVAALDEAFLRPAVRGGWMDRLDQAGRPLVDTIPASSFYHLFLMASEYLLAKRA